MKLPVVSGGEAAKAFRKLGYELDEQHGSHMILGHTAPPHRRLSIPNHKELAQRSTSGTDTGGWAYGGGVRGTVLRGPKPGRIVWWSPPHSGRLWNFYSQNEYDILQP